MKPVPYCLSCHAWTPGERAWADTGHYVHDDCGGRVVYADPAVATQLGPVCPRCSGRGVLQRRLDGVPIVCTLCHGSGDPPPRRLPRDARLLRYAALSRPTRSRNP